MNRRRFLQAIGAAPAVPAGQPRRLYWYHRVASGGVIPCGADWPLRRKAGDVLLIGPGWYSITERGPAAAKWWSAASMMADERLCRVCFPALLGEGG